MSLYGLDILQDKDGRYFLSEINGVLSGMAEFKSIYGDNRVQQRVYRMLRDRHGEITLYDPAAAKRRFQREHPVRAAVGGALLRMPFVKLAMSLHTHPLLRSPKAHTAWMQDSSPWHQPLMFPFASYEGQDSTVLNAVNDFLPHPLVNPYAAEDATRNKLLQHLILQKTSVRQHLPVSTVIGLGWAKEGELHALRTTGTTFVMKPLLGNRGMGVRPVGVRALDDAVAAAGAVDDTSRLYREAYLEDVLGKQFYSCEHGLALLQQRIDTKRPVQNLRLPPAKMHSFIRAIVCNGQFVDAYQAVSKHFVVNAARESWELFLDDTQELASLSERVVAEFERVCTSYDPREFKLRLYSDYFVRDAPRQRPAAQLRNPLDFVGGRVLSIGIDYLAHAHKIVKDF